MSEPTRGLLDTNLLILRDRIDESDLPDESAISTITLAELAAGPHHVPSSDPDAALERARRVERLQRIESEFDPIPFDAEAARAFGRVTAAVLSSGRTTRSRIADLLIAAVAAANGLPVHTANPSDFAGLDGVVEVRAVRVLDRKP